MRAIVAGCSVERELLVEVEEVETEQAGLMDVELTLLPMDCHLMEQLVLTVEYHSRQMLQGVLVVSTVADSLIELEQFASLQVLL